MRYIIPLIFLSINLSIASELDFEITPQSSISLGGGYDTDKNKDYNLYVDLELPNFHHLGFGYFKNESSLDNSITDNYNLSVASSAYETTSLDANFSYTKLSDTMKSYSFSSGININLENWHFALTPKLKTITYYLNSDRQNTFNIFSKGSDISASYFGFEQYYFSANYTKNYFSKKTNFLRPIDFSSLTNNATNNLDVVNQHYLEDQRIQLAVGRYYDWGDLDLNWSYSKLFNIAHWLGFAAIDELKESTNVQSYTASSNFIINKQFSVGFSLGLQTTSSDSDKLLFTSSEISYSW